MLSEVRRGKDLPKAAAGCKEVGNGCCRGGCGGNEGLKGGISDRTRRPSFSVGATGGSIEQQCRIARIYARDIFNLATSGNRF